MTQPLDHDELRGLLDALCEQTITPEQAERLEELVMSHPEAEALYVQYLSLHADLATHLAALPCPTEQALHQRAADKAPARAKAWRPRRYVVAASLLGLAAAAAVLAASAITATVQAGRQPGTSSRSTRTEPAATASAMTSHMAAWKANEP